MIKSPKGTWELCVLVPNIYWEALFFHLACIPFEKEIFQCLTKLIDYSGFKEKSIIFPSTNVLLEDIGYKKIKHWIVSEIMSMASPNSPKLKMEQMHISPTSLLVQECSLRCFFCCFLQSSSKLFEKSSLVQFCCVIKHIDSLADSVWWGFSPQSWK